MKWFDIDNHGMICNNEKRFFYVPGITSNTDLIKSIKIILNIASWEINHNKVETRLGKHGKIVLEYDETPNPTVFIVNYIYTNPIDMVEISFNKNKLKYSYTRSFNPHTHCFPFIEEKIRFINSKLIKWNEFGGRLKERLIELI